MILQEEFKKSGYKDILVGNIASEYRINLEDLFDLDQKPEELLCIFISKQRDDLFFLLDGDLMEINTLCDRWDDRIRVFMIINGKAEMIHKLKYNVVQLIVYSKEILDKSREGNLLISRKILIKGDMTDKNQIVIDDDEVIELPFHMIPTDAFAPDTEQMCIRDRGEHDTDIQHRPPHRGGGIKLFRRGHKLHIVLLEQLHHIGKVQNGTADTVELVNHDFCN